MSPEEWVGVVEREYLGSFVQQGGAAVKFAAAPQLVVEPSCASA